MLAHYTQHTILISTRSVGWNMLPTKYSRHLQNIHEKSKKSRNSLDTKLISMIDEEQLKRAPSSEDWWTRRKSQILEARDDQSFCPCLSTMFSNQASVDIPLKDRVIFEK